MENKLLPLDIEDYAKKFSGKILLRQEIPLNDEQFQQLLTLQNFTPTPSIIKKFPYYQCQRCGSRKRSLLPSFPCATCGKEHLYCRNCISMGRILECEPLYVWSGPSPAWEKHTSPCTWEGELTPAQQKAADRIEAVIGNNEKELLVWAVCGAGKTEMLFPGIAKGLEQGKRICIATPRADVVRELKPRIQKAFQHVTVQALYGGSKDKEADAQLLLATTHQLLRFKQAFDVMIIDEVDAFPYHKDPSLPFAAERAKTDASSTIYLTATPRKEHQLRMDRKQLPHVFVPLRYHGHPLPVPQMKMTFSLRKDLRNHEPPSAFLSWLQKRENPKRQLLIFVPTIAMAENLHENIAKLLLQEKVIQTNKEITFVHAEDPDRAKKVQRFRDREITVIITTTILERGVTFPSVDVAVIDAGHDVFDEAALVQIAGRAGRSADDPTGEVIFFHDGKSEAMVQAIRAIQKMNKRGGELHGMPMVR